ncbi:MAG: MATE family efflux transporter, partial [Planctomycetota bacterium]
FDQGVLSPGVRLILGAIFMLSTRTLNHFFYGMHRPKVVFVATVTGNIVNVFSNYVLIFGAFGFPELGLHGAALGTLIGSFVEMLIPLMIFLGPKMNQELNTRSAWKVGTGPAIDLIRLGWPKGLTFANEMLCWAIFMIVLVGQYFGEVHMTAGWITLKYMHLSFMPAVGISFAVTAVVGRYIGAGRLDLANQRAWVGVGMACVFMGFCAIMFVIFRQPMAELFVNVQIEQAGSPEEAAALREMSGDIVSITMTLLICAAVFQVFDGIAITLSGALTGAGDTIWPGVANVVVSWTCIVGLGWAMCEYMPHLKSLGPWIGAATFIIVLGILYYFRWRGGHWRTIQLVKRKKAQPAAEGAATPVT